MNEKKQHDYDDHSTTFAQTSSPPAELVRGQLQEGWSLTSVEA